MSDIINSLAHRAEVEQAKQIRAELCESRGLGSSATRSPPADDQAGLIDLHISRSTVSLYATAAECKAARDALVRLRSELSPQLNDIEQYRMQMAGISTAAHGYWKSGDPIHPDYDTPALRDVAKLYAEYAQRSAELDQLRARVAELEAAAPAPAGEPVAWADADAICNAPDVDEAIRTLLDDQTGDNAVEVVRAILRYAQPAAARVPLTAAQQHADELLTVLDDLLPFVATNVVESCNGAKCREAWCAGCNGHEEASAAVDHSLEAYRCANSVIAKIEAAGQEGGAA